jgi:hypothetical protein
MATFFAAIQRAAGCAVRPGKPPHHFGKTGQGQPADDGQADDGQHAQGKGAILLSDALKPPM